MGRGTCIVANICSVWSLFIKYYTTHSVHILNTFLKQAGVSRDVIICTSMWHTLAKKKKKKRHNCQTLCTKTKCNYKLSSYACDLGSGQLKRLDGCSGINRSTVKTMSLLCLVTKCASLYKLTGQVVCFGMGISLKVHSIHIFNALPKIKNKKNHLS